MDVPRPGSVDGRRARHVVQTVRDPGFRDRGVADWTAPALLSGGGAVLLGRPSNLATIREAIAKRGVDVEAAKREGRLVLLDGVRVLDGFLVDGSVDRIVFWSSIAPVLDAVAARVRSPEIRAWGEMVDVLWERGAPAEARRLEGFWNELLEEYPTTRLLCSYELDNLDPTAHAGPLRDLCEGHSVLFAEEHEQDFDVALTRALAEVFGSQHAPALRDALAARATIPIEMTNAQATFVALHDLQPALGRRVADAIQTALGAPFRRLGPAP